MYQMGPRRKLREITGILKDKASIIKATLTTKRANSKMMLAILRATTHTSAAPPPDHRLEDILSLGANIPPVACACIDSIMDRLHNTRDPHVALKCLLILHHILTHGSFILKEQLSYYPSNGGQNSLNLMRFGGDSRHIISDVEIWELSQWVRWYACVLERNLISSRTIGCYINSSSSSPSPNYLSHGGFRNVGNSNRSLDFGLLIREIDSLVCMIEGICEAPESLHYQKMDSVHELMLLVSEDYRGTQYHIIARLGELGDVLDELSLDNSSELLRCLKRLEGCRERLTEMFANRKRNDAFWGLTSQTRRGLEEVNERRERGRMVVWKAEGERAMVKLTGNGERVKGASQVIKLLPHTTSQWLGGERD